MSDDLVARLRRWKQVVPTTRERMQMVEDMREAAAALEAKDARIAELTAALKMARQGIINARRPEWDDHSTIHRIDIILDPDDEPSAGDYECTR